MTRTRFGVSVALVGAILLTLAAGAQAKKSFSTLDVKGTYTFRLVPATSFAPFYDGTSGKPNSGIATAPRQDILRVGVFTADGNGNLTGHTIATTDDGLTTVVIDFNWTGTYTVNADGTGTLSIVAPTVINTCVDGNSPPNPVTGCAAFEGAETYAIVINRHGDEKAVELIETDNNGGGAKIFLTGLARRQHGGDS